MVDDLIPVFVDFRRKAKVDSMVSRVSGIRNFSIFSNDLGAAHRARSSSFIDVVVDGFCKAVEKPFTAHTSSVAHSRLFIRAIANIFCFGASVRK